MATAGRASRPVIRSRRHGPERPDAALRGGTRYGPTSLANFRGSRHSAISTGREEGGDHAMSTLQRSVTPWFFPLLAGVVIVQGIHVIEHIIQLLQVFVFGVADDDAFGLLGYVFKFQGTEEWL